jgi:DNA-binding MarR family transcriptional regulator
MPFHALSCKYISCYDQLCASSRYDIICRMAKPPTHLDYQSLAELRHQIRRFLHFSEQAARSVGLEPRQHQLMLALKGLPKGVRPRITELAERLQIQHHSAVELANRLVAGGYIKRSPGGEDRREVWLSLTAKGERVLKTLSLHHRNELRAQGPELLTALRRVVLGNKNSSVKPSQITKKSKAKTKSA